MATITHIKTPDGVIHDIGGGGGGSSTYTLTKSGSTITLTGSGGDVSSVVDSNTTYSISISGHTLTLTPSSGTAQTVTVPDDNTTYTISVSGSTITLTPSSGSAQTITIPDATTSASGVMSASDKSKLNGIASGAEVNVQSDWNQTDSTADDYIKNKPTIPPGVTVDSALSTTSTNPVENRVITNALDNKVDKETGKGLSTNDFTTAEKNKLAGIQAGAEQNVQSDWDEADSTSDAYIKNKPTIPTVGDGTLTIQKNGTTIDTFTANQSSNTTVNVTVPTATSDLTNDSDFVSDASYVHTDNNFTTTLKNKLDGIQAGAEVNVQSNWTQSDSTADDFIKNKPTLAIVATSGDYDDLTNKPTIPTVNDGTLTIQKNGTTIDSFTANQSGNTTVNVTVPTATSDLTNDSNYVSDASYVHTDNNFTTTLKNKLNGIEAGAEVNVQADWNEADSTADDYIKNKPTLSTVATTGDYDDLSNKPTIPTVSVTQKTSIGTNIADITVNGTTTQLFAPSGGGGAIEYALSGSGDDDEYTITATPTSGTATSATIPAANQTDAGVMTALDKTKLDGVATGAEVNVQSDWNEANSSSDAYILNKPTIPTATSDLINDSDFVSKGDPVRVGEYYEDDQTHAIEIGNGTSSTPSNSLSVDWNGNVVTDGGGTFHGAITREATEAERIASGGAFVRVIVTGVSEYTEDQKIYLGVGGNGSNMGIYLPAHGAMTNGYFLIREYYASGTPRIEIGSSDVNGVRALGHSSNIGTISSSDGSKSIASGGSMLKVADLFTLPAGAWVICVGVQFPDNSTGTRAARLYFDGAAAATAYQAYPAGAGVRAMNLSAVVNIGSSSDVDLYARQNSGSSMTVTYWARAMRII